MKNKIYKSIKVLAISTIIITSFSSCITDEGPVVIENIEIDLSDITFAKDIQPIFTNRCIACHNETHVTGLNLKDGFSYNLLVNHVSTNYAPNYRISAGDKEGSVLWHKINDDTVFGGKMPKIGAPLSSFEIQKIEKWIELGALNN